MDIKKNDYVRIKANNEWHDKIGICKDVCNNVAAIFCVQFPIHLYYVSASNREDVEKIDINKI
ncbi:hypothetical protein [Clostridium sp. DJ247]|uniref:hypothetical protein n=1 Tax=Clostridium sp. DJ247 TaxID=2726188 RepID=UPI001625A7BE|nr:hypothetical protein [Clostridium sp. DJ247]MBC2581357.1 hypothetical protein [Clostridium sp. DJ247]